jgi:hypothetical protein
MSETLLSCVHNLKGVRAHSFGKLIKDVAEMSLLA